MRDLFHQGLNQKHSFLEVFSSENYPLRIFSQNPNSLKTLKKVFLRIYLDFQTTVPKNYRVDFCHQDINRQV